MLSFPPNYNVQPPRQPSPLPKRTDSLSVNAVEPNSITRLQQSREDIKFARVVLSTPITSEQDANNDVEERGRRREEREPELIDILGRMTSWVEELTSLLQQNFKNQSDLETALTLERSNLQLALANNEMLEEALKRGGKDVGWRRWSEREGVRRSSSVKEFVQDHRSNEVLPNPSPPPPQQQQSGPSRFFNFKSTLQRVSSNNTSPTLSHNPSSPHSLTASASTPSLLPSITIPSSSSSGGTPVPPVPPQNGAPVTPPTPTMAGSSTAYYSSRPGSPSLTLPSEREKALAALLEKERTALKALTTEKAQLEGELESLSQALFEEANKMVSRANRKLAETEEELRVVMEQKEALKGALRIVEGENGQLRGQSTQASPSPAARASHGESVGGGWQHEKGTLPPDESVSVYADHDKDLATSGPETHPHLQAQSILGVYNPAIMRGSVTGTAPPPPPEQQRSGPSASVPGPPLTINDVTNSFSDPITHSIDIPSPTPPPTSTPPATSMPISPNFPLTGRARHRWSIMPKSPRSRSQVRDELEEAVRRMQDLVGEDGAVPASEPASPHGPETLSRRIDFARTLGESEVQDEVTVREPNPWTS